MASPPHLEWVSTVKACKAAFTSNTHKLTEALADRIKNDFQAQLQLIQNAHDCQLKDMQMQISELNDQLTTTVKGYNELVTGLNTQLEAAQSSLQRSEQVRSDQVSRLNNQIQLDDDQLQQTLDDYKNIVRDLTKQVDTAKRQISDRESNFQRQRLILIQTNDQLKAENDELKHANAALQEDNDMLKRRMEGCPPCQAAPESTEEID